jgi:hypothetical protein
LADRIERAAHELADQVTRVPVAPPADPFADVVPFERLLVGE